MISAEVRQPVKVRNLFENSENAWAEGLAEWGDRAVPVDRPLERHGEWLLRSVDGPLEAAITARILSAVGKPVLATGRVMLYPQRQLNREFRPRASKRSLDMGVVSIDGSGRNLDVIVELKGRSAKVNDAMGFCCVCGERWGSQITCYPHIVFGLDRPIPCVLISPHKQFVGKLEPRHVASGEWDQSWLTWQDEMEETWWTHLSWSDIADVADQCEERKIGSVLRAMI